MEDERVCDQCDETFYVWQRFKSLDGEIDNIDTQACFCSPQCYEEWRLDNRAELCN